jgi:hypothetical protein
MDDIPPPLAGGVRGGAILLDVVRGLKSLPRPLPQAEGEQK